MCTNVHIILSMEVEWEARKAASNRRKHGVDLADAATVLYDDFAMTVTQEDPSEQRYVTVGTDALGRVLVVVYTWRGERVRLISARRATAYERRQYEEGT